MYCLNLKGFFEGGSIGRVMSQNGRGTFCPSRCDKISSCQISMCWIAIELRFCTFINAMEGNIKRLKGFNENIIEK